MKVLLFINFSIIRILIFPNLILQHDSKNPPINPFFYHAPQPCPFIAIFPGYTNSNSRDGTETFTQCNYKWPETFMGAVIDPLCTCKRTFHLTCSLFYHRITPGYWWFHLQIPNIASLWMMFCHLSKPPKYGSSSTKFLQNFTLLWINKCSKSGPSKHLPQIISWVSGHQN